VGAIAESATMAISNKAREMKAAGSDVISYGAGEPDFPTPDHIVDAAAAACRDPKNHKYSANAGLIELREAVAMVTARDGGPTVDPKSQVLVTNGGKQSVFQTFAALVSDGDEVIVPAPYWVTYPEAIQLAGGVPVPIATDSAAGFKVTVDQLDAALTDKTKLLVFVSPSNPTGAVYTPDETAAIGAWAADNDVWVMTDEIYQHLVYGDTVFTSLPSVAPGLDDRWVIVSGVAKTFAMTGWRVGWMIGPADVIKAAANLQSHATSNVANVSQWAAFAALTGPMEPMAEMRRAFDHRRQQMHSMLDGIDGVTCLLPGGAFYCFPDFRDLVGTDVAGRRIESSMDLCAVLLDEAGVAAVPGEAFGAPGYARFSYALAEADLIRGLQRVQDLLS
jgi:aspartate/methionine/tyrosine aminotransferase